MSKILHISDIHFPLKPEAITFREIIHPKRILALTNYILRRRSRFRDAPAKWKALLRYIDQNEFDAILCTGDLTAMGMRRELAIAHDYLKPLLDRPEFIIMPGNHDIYLPGTAAGLYDRFFPPNKQENILSIPENAYPFIQLIEQDGALLVLNSSKPNPVIWLSSGYISPEQMNAARTLIEQNKDVLENRLLIAATHFNIDDEDSWRHGMENRKEVRDFLSKINCRMVAHGHIHHQRDTAIPGFTPQVCCAGSLTYRNRESFWVYSVNNDKIKAHPGMWNGQEYTLEQ